MTYNIIKLMTYLIAVGLSAYGLDAIDFTKIMGRYKVGQVRVLYIVLTLALAYLVANFILSFISIRLI